MKMSKETFDLIVWHFSAKLVEIQRHKEWIRENGVYMDLLTRLAWDVYYSLPANVKDAVRREDLNDRHINTALHKALKEVGITE